MTEPSAAPFATPELAARLGFLAEAAAPICTSEPDEVANVVAADGETVDA
jgi:hypothetical protein